MDDIVAYGTLEPENYGQTEELREHIVETAEQYGFEVALRENMDYPGIIATNGDYIEVDPDFIDKNAITYLWPELMEEKIVSRIQVLRGTYEDQHFGLEEELERNQLSSEINREISGLNDRMWKNMHEAEEAETISEETAIERNEQLAQEINRLENKSNLLTQPQTAQANLYMLNEQVSANKDPAKTIAVQSYNPAMYDKDREYLEGFFEEHFTAFPWLASEAREQVIDYVEEINEELGRKAEQMEMKEK